MITTGVLVGSPAGAAALDAGDGITAPSGGAALNLPGSGSLLPEAFKARPTMSPTEAPTPAEINS